MLYIWRNILMGHIWGPILQIHPIWKTRDMRYHNKFSWMLWRLLSSQVSSYRKLESAKCYGSSIGLMFHRWDFIWTSQQPCGVEVPVHTSQMRILTLWEGTGFVQGQRKSWFPERKAHILPPSPVCTHESVYTSSLPLPSFRDETCPRGT